MVETALCPIHGQIGIAQYRVNIRTVLRVDRDANAGGENHFRRGKRLLTAEAVPEARSKGIHFTLIGKRFNGHKLIAAKARDHLLLLQRFQHGACHTLQQLVTNQMALQVINLFKLV